MTKATAGLLPLALLMTAALLWPARSASDSAVSGSRSVIEDWQGSGAPQRPIESVPYGEGAELEDGADLSLTAVSARASEQPPLIVSGTATWHDGQPIRKRSLELWATFGMHTLLLDSRELHGLATDDYGRFEIRGAPGLLADEYNYVTLGNAENYSPPARRRSFSLGDTEVALVCSRRGSIVGRVAMPNALTPSDLLISDGHINYWNFFTPLEQRGAFELRGRRVRNNSDLCVFAAGSRVTPIHTVKDVRAGKLDARLNPIRIAPRLVTASTIRVLTTDGARAPYWLRGLDGAKRPHYVHSVDGAPMRIVLPTGIPILVQAQGYRPATITNPRADEVVTLRRGIPVAFIAPPTEGEARLKWDSWESWPAEYGRQSISVEGRPFPASRRLDLSLPGPGKYTPELHVEIAPNRWRAKEFQIEVRDTGGQEFEMPFDDL